MRRPERPCPAGGAGGFTLIELAVVVAIVGLLLGALLVPLATRVSLQSVRETQASLAEVKDALTGFAVVNGRLPCPDTDDDGAENGRLVADDPGDGCEGGVYEGRLPWLTLGLGRQDAWGFRFTYRVSNEFTRETGNGSATVPPCSLTAQGDNSCTLELGDTGNIIIEGRDEDSASASFKAKTPLANGVPAIVISHGENGYGATNIDGNVMGAPPASNVDELENTDGNNTFRFRVRGRLSSACDDTEADTSLPFCEFDDLAVWISPNLLMGRMVVAGRLP